MPTPISHATVGFAIGAWTAPAPPSTRVCIAAAACAALPDIDFFWSLGLPEASPLAHRAITHSLVFALVAAFAVAFIFFSDERWRSYRGRLTAAFLLALLSHSCLDALSTYSYGIAFFAPFSAERFRFPWTPLGRPDGTIASQLIEEGLVLVLPGVALAGLALKVRRAP